MSASEVHASVKRAVASCLAVAPARGDGHPFAQVCWNSCCTAPSTSGRPRPGRSSEGFPRPSPPNPGEQADGSAPRSPRVGAHRWQRRGTRPVLDLSHRPAGCPDGPRSPPSAGPAGCPAHGTCTRTRIGRPADASRADEVRLRSRQCALMIPTCPTCATSPKHWVNCASRWRSWTAPPARPAGLGETTQPDGWLRLRKILNERGTLDVLRRRVEMLGL